MQRFFIGSIYNANSIINVELDWEGRLWTNGKKFPASYEKVHLSKAYFGGIRVRLMKKGAMHYQFYAVTVENNSTFSKIKSAFAHNPNVVVKFK